MKIRINLAALLLCPIIGCPASYAHTAGVTTDAYRQAGAVAEACDQFDLMIRKMAADFNEAKPDAEVRALLDKIGPDGAFSDIDYTDKSRTNWRPNTHLERLFSLTQTYVNPGNYQGSEEVYDAITKGALYWEKLRPKSSNWWYNSIATPRLLGKILVKMRTATKQLDPATEDALFRVIEAQEYDDAHNTGANQTDMAMNRIYHACLKKRDSMLRDDLAVMFGNLAYTTEEGIQHDHAFQQHGPQLYIGGYGEVLLKTVTQTAVYTAGTEFALNADQLDALKNFIRDAFFATIRGNVMAFDVAGRSVSRRGSTSQKNAAVLADHMVILDPANAQEYRDIASRIRKEQPASYAVRPSNRHFFRCDYTLHMRPEYTFDVRTVSTRTARCEKGNGENLKGYYLSDGCTSIRMSGDEYFDIFPVWDWSRIPGTTAPHSETVPTNRKDWQVPGESTFAGGVSDGTTGVAAYKYYDSKVLTGADKAWFMLDDGIVCLGSGIRSYNTSDAINTTLNQCLLGNGKVKVCNGGKVTTVGKKGTFTSPEWLIHNNIGYFLPDGGELIVEADRRTGSWYDINNTQNKETVAENVFTACLNHGVGPTDGRYSYIIVPGISSESDARKYASAHALSILSNSPSIQAVRSNYLGQTGIVFYNPDKFSCDAFDVSVSAPCILLINDDGSFSIADPAQNQKDITVSLKMNNQKEIIVNCNFSDSGVYAGASKHFDTSGNQTDAVSVNKDDKFSIKSDNGRLIIDNCSDDALVRVYDLNGRMAYSGNSGIIDGLGKGCYLVNIEGETAKIAL